MASREKAAAERLKDDEDVRRALKQAGASADESTEKPPVKRRHTLFVSTYILLLVLLGGVYYALRLGYFDYGFTASYLPAAQRFALGLIAVVVVFGMSKAIDYYFIDRVEDAASRYTLHRVLRLLTWLVIFFIALSLVFANWYTAVVSLGLLSLILGFALQTPITSFIGWVYILVRAPYRVGDRIRIKDATGDVIDIGYFDTTLWEFGGPQLSTEHPSGRVVKFPNSDVLSSAVFNSSWPLFPYAWQEITFYIAYTSDLEFVERVMRETAEAEIGAEMGERVRVYRELLAQTPINELEVQERPVVSFRANPNTWIDATVRYLVEPREAGRVKTTLTKKMLARLNAEPERAQFPKEDAR